MRRTANILTQVFCFVAVLSCGCAAVVAPVAQVGPPGEADDKVGLEIVEGRPDSIVLSAVVSDARAGDQLQLTRASADDEPVPLVQVTLDGKLLELAKSDGIGLSDDTLREGSSYRYETRVVRGEELVNSADVSVTWGEAPGRPEQVEAVQLLEGIVEVTWSPGVPAALFVRDVLDEASGLERIDVSEAAGGRWILRGLEPDGVYAVRVALSRRESNYVRFGPPSEEVYVTLTVEGGGDDAGTK